MDQGELISRVEAETTTLSELLMRYLMEITPLKKGSAPETARILALLRHPMAQHVVASIRGVDIARFRDERLKKVRPGTVKRDLVILSHLFEVARKEWDIHVHNPVRDIQIPSDSKSRDRHLQAGENGHDSQEIRLLAVCREARNPFSIAHCTPRPRDRHASRRTGQPALGAYRSQPPHCLSAGYQKRRVTHRAALNYCGKNPTLTPAQHSRPGVPRAHHRSRETRLCPRRAPRRH